MKLNGCALVVDRIKSVTSGGLASNVPGDEAAMQVLVIAWPRVAVNYWIRAS